MKRNWIPIVVVALLVLIVMGAATTAIDLYTEWLFFSELNLTGVFSTILSTKILLGFASALVAFCFLVANIVIANRSTFPPVRLVYSGQTVISLDVHSLSRWIKPLSVLSGVVVSFLVGVWGSSLWEEVLVFENSIAAGISDPIFGKDIGFYLFQLPLFEYLNGLAKLIIGATLLIVAVTYFLRGGIAVPGREMFVDSRVKKHLAALAGLYILAVAVSFHLDTFRLLLSPHGVIYGAGYAAIHSQRFVLPVLSVLTAVSAVLFVVGTFRSSWKIAVAPLGLTALVYLIGLLIYPPVLQKLKVTPNELALERNYIEHHISFTRYGYDLQGLEVRPFDVSYNLTPQDIRKNNATIENIRLWDDMPLLRTYSQLQQIRTYYKFKDVDNDRYVIDGEYMQVMMSPRELSYDDLPSRSWINEKIVFTHGIGITMGPVSRISREGLPDFIIKDIPPVSSADIKVTRPEIYFGEISSDYVLVKTKVPEFDYPTTEGNVYTTYEGSGGVSLSSYLRRALFAVKFGSEKLLLSSDITSQSRILYNRDISKRIRQIAPFLLFDSDPYIVVSGDGRLFWIVDAYTVSDKVPYSQPLNSKINYIRNSVKVTIDAYNGSVNFYISDPGDVLIKVYQAIFPGLFKPLSVMPEDLRKHIRYPKGFLQVQAGMYSTFHMTDPKVFYNKEDLWELPSYGDKPIEPYYTIMKLPEEQKEEYILLLPYTPAKRDNLAAWLAGRCDGPHYGKLIVYTFPRDRLVFGPRQVDARIDQDSYISQQLTLWGQRGSQVIRGSLLVIPIESSLLYVQPLYLAAEDKGGLPELRRVILAYENNVVMEENLEAGLQRLFGARAALPARETAVSDTAAPIDDLAREAVRTFDEAQDMLRKGDWASYGERMKKLGETLRRMAK
ncbi:MAG: UPF0182 family protein [Chloroflexota bacterium]